MLSVQVIGAFSLLAAAVAQHVKVEPAVFGFVGNQVVLPCQFVDPASSVQVTQVTWVKDPSGAMQNLAVHNPKYGTSYPVETNNQIHFRAASLTDASLVIDRLLMSDDGIYSCEFDTYPEGYQEAATNLTVLAEPKTSGGPLLVKSAKSPVPVARCVAANGKPPASITWRGNVSGNATTELTQNADGTTTVTSQYEAVPTGELDGVMLQCVITQRTLERPRVIDCALSIQYLPIVTIEGYDDNWYLDREHASLTCNVKANPAATDYRWLMNGGDLPSGVQTVGHQLTVDQVTFQVNGTFICEASNPLGRTSGSIEIFVRAAVAQHVKVEPAVFGFVGNQVVLPCQFVDPVSSVQVTQVTWVKDPSGAKQKLAVYNPKYGTNYPVDTNSRIHFRAASLTDASLVIDRLLMSDDGIYSCEFATYPEGDKAAATKLTVLAAVAQHVQVEPAVFGFVGNQVVLSCQFVDPDSSLEVTQVTWVKDPSGAKQKLAVRNAKYGTNYPVDTNNRIHFQDASLTDASLVIDRLLMSDEGIYSCEFAIYPKGNLEAATNLTVLAESKISGNALPVMSGKSPVPVARCVAAGGKPPASITWRGNVPGNATTELTQNADGTTTVTSWFLAVPGRQLDGVMLQCVVTQRTVEWPRVINSALSIQYGDEGN